MKLKIYNHETAHSLNGNRKPTIAFYSRGTISVSGPLADALNLESSRNGLLIAQDEESPLDWYIKPDNTGVIFKGTKKREGDKSLQAYSKKICNDILEILEVDKATMRVATVANEEGWYPILTASLKK